MKLVLVVKRQDLVHVLYGRLAHEPRLEETDHLVPRIRGYVRERKLRPLARRGRRRREEGVHVVGHARQQERVDPDEVLLAPDHDFEVGLAELVQPPRQEGGADGEFLVGSLRSLFIVGIVYGGGCHGIHRIEHSSLFLQTQQVAYNVRD